MLAFSTEVAQSSTPWLSKGPERFWMLSGQGEDKALCPEFGFKTQLKYECISCLLALLAFGRKASTWHKDTLG